MKFRLGLGISNQRNLRNVRKRKTQHNVLENDPETWKELREIGSHEVYVKHTDPDFDHQAEAMKEGHDWDFYIARFNEQYRKQLKEEKRLRELDSVSTIADTQSMLLQNRQKRMEVFRRCFIASCLALWVVFIFLQNHWYLVFRWYPTGFLEAEEKTNIFKKLFDTRNGFVMFVLNLHPWFIGCVGILAAMCFRDSPWLLRQFILRMPFMTLIPILLIICGVKFTGELSTTKLQQKMEILLAHYYDADQKVANESRVQWKRAQQALQCCGVFGTSDWDSVDIDLTDNKTYLPESCCAPKWYRDIWSNISSPPAQLTISLQLNLQEKNRVTRDPDDCLKKIDRGRKLYEWAYTEGCLDKAFEFFIKQGAFFVAFMFSIFLIQVICLVLGKQYYTLHMKTMDIKFKYHFKDWFLDIIFLSCLFSYCSSQPEHQFVIKSRTALQRDSDVSEDTLLRLPSVVVTHHSHNNEETPLHNHGMHLHQQQHGSTTSIDIDKRGGGLTTEGSDTSLTTLLEPSTTTIFTEDETSGITTQTSAQISKQTLKKRVK